MQVVPKILVIAVILVTVLVITAYAVTVLFTQTTLGPSISKPGSGAAISDCSTLTLPVSNVGATNSYQSGYWAATCNGSSAFNVTKAGTFLPTTTVQSVCCGASYNNVVLMNFTGSPNLTPSYCPGTSILFSSSSTILSVGGYYYCLGWSLNAYTAQTPSSFPSVSISWNSP